MSADTTKAQVAELLDKGMEAKDIAEKLGKTKATVYSHIANIRKDRGDTTPRKRGRPPKNQNGDGGDSKPATTRQRPPVGKPASEKATAEKATDATAEKVGKLVGSTNGSGSRFPIIHAAIEQELSEARAKVVVLERMLETV